MCHFVALHGKLTKLTEKSPENCPVLAAEHLDVSMDWLNKMIQFLLNKEDVNTVTMEFIAKF